MTIKQLLRVYSRPNVAAKRPKSIKELPTRVRALVEASLADNTHRAYEGAIRAFAAWCKNRNYQARPADPATVAEYLSDLIAAGRRGACVKAHACAIGHDHRRAGVGNPIDTYLVRAVIRGSMRLRGSYVDQKLAIDMKVIDLILSNVPRTLKGIRDRALITLGFAGAFRRAELVALRVEDLAFSAEGVVVQIRKSKTDIESKGTEIGIPNGQHLKPVDALQEWITAAKITKGPIFRPVYRNRVVSRSVLPVLVSSVLKGYLAKANFDPNLYGAHSLRAGFITSAAEVGVSLDRIMDHSRHTDRNTVRRYVRRASLFRDHPGKDFL